MGHLRGYLERQLDGWRNDLTPDWQIFFAEVDPDFSAVNFQLEHDPRLPMIPSRRIYPLEGAPANAHVFRAFDGLQPDKVRVVVIGQDPYPNKARATGRAFEDGALIDWKGAVALSLRSLMQSTLALRLSEPILNSGKRAWYEIHERVCKGDIELEAIGVWFDRLQLQEGVLFVNAGWTLTRFAPLEQKAHIAMWQPLMKHLLERLAERDSPTLFLLFGNFAQNLFAATEVELKARSSGVWQTRVGAVFHPHPNAPSYFNRGNPLQAVNKMLVELGSNEIVW